MLRLRRPRFPLHAARRAAAGLLAAVALVLALRPPPEPVPAAGSAPVASVVVAGADLPAGTVLRPDDLRTVGYPAGLAPGGHSADPAELAGRVLAAAVRAGEPVTDVRLVGAGLTALLPAGQVAAPVRPSDLAVTGLVRAGDRVDVLATGPGAERAEVVTAGALVLAAPGPRTGERAGEPATPDSGGLLVLAVDGDTAARLAAAAAGATLTVALSRAGP